MIKENERLEDLQFEGLKIIQADGGYKFSTDSVLLANFGKAKPNDIYVDLCSGSGVVAILFSCKNKIKKSYAVEIQPRLADMAQRSVEENGLEDKITVLNEDLSDVYKTLGYESVDVITVNPPYNVAGDVSETSEIAIATHEIKTNLEKIVLSSSKLLKYGGKLFMVHRADRLVDIANACRKFDLEPKVLRIVYPTIKKEPNLVLVEAKKGAKPGLKFLSPLVLNKENGEETDELKEIYGRQPKK
ncbi:MAG: tRNA1(Val) (adenine(37)-N6)-methyltransferase [Clostridia bacterium]|nr:tRNA1(Val) (adenine(37)-N6)-methyltransferase [Clostridia bacterium]